MGELKLNDDDTQQEIVSLDRDSIANLVPNDARALKETLENIIAGQKKRSISFGFVVLNSVVQGNYDRALKELEEVTTGLDDYPEFGRAATRYVEHAKGLVKAIKTKRSVTLSRHINKSKRRELMERIMVHFFQLKQCIISIERIEKKIRYKDLSTTIIFLKSLFFAMALLMFAAFLTYGYPEVVPVPEVFLQSIPWFQFGLP